MDRCDREGAGDWTGRLHYRHLCWIVLWLEAASAERGAGDDVQGGWGEKAFPFAPPQRLKAHASEPGWTASLKRCPDTNLFRPVPLHIPLTSSSPDLLFSVGTLWLPPPLFSNNRPRRQSEGWRARSLPWRDRSRGRRTGRASGGVQAHHRRFLQSRECLRERGSRTGFLL